SAASLGGTQRIVNGANAIETDRYGKAEAFEELAVFRREQCAVGGDRETDRNAAFAGKTTGKLGRAPEDGAVDERVAAEKGEIDPLGRSGSANQSSHRTLGRLPRHVSGRAAEAAAFGIAIGAAEIAAFCHRKRQCSQRRIMRRLLADVACKAEAPGGE